jgi:hypothetical protein
MNPLCLLSLVVLLAAVPVRAAESDARAQARALSQEGARHYNRGEYEAALEKFQEAYRTFANPRILFNVGQVQRDLGRPVEAIESFERFLAEAGDAPAPARAAAGKWLEELRAKVATVEVSCGLDGAEVTLDGQSHGQTPLPRPLTVMPGPHQLLVEKAGFVTFAARLNAERGARTSIEARLEPVPPPAPPAPAPVVRPAPVPAPAPPRWSVTRKIGVGLAGAGVASAATGLFFGSKARGEAQQISDQCSGGCTASDIHDLDQRRLSHGRTQWILLGAGAAALVGGTVLILAGGSGGAEKVEVEAALGPGSIALRGRW